MKFKKYIKEENKPKDFTLKKNKQGAYAIFKGNKKIDVFRTGTPEQNKANAVSKMMRLQKELDRKRKDREYFKVTPVEARKIREFAIDYLKKNKEATVMQIANAYSPNLARESFKVKKVLDKMEKEGILKSEVKSSYETVAISTGHFGGATALKRKKKHYRLK